MQKKSKKKVIFNLALATSLIVSPFLTSNSSYVDAKGFEDMSPDELVELEYDFENPRNPDGSIMSKESIDDLFSHTDDYIMADPLLVKGTTWFEPSCKKEDLTHKDFHIRTFFTIQYEYKDIKRPYSTSGYAMFSSSYRPMRTSNQTPKFQTEVKNGDTYQGLLFRDQDTYEMFIKNRNEVMYLCPEPQEGEEPNEHTHYGSFDRGHQVYFKGKLYNTRMPEITGKHGSNGDVTATVKWKLKRNNPNSDSDIETELSAKKSGSHYATKDLHAEVTVNGNQTPTVAKRDSTLKLDANYHYTNYWKLVCGETSCWKVPDWDKGEDFIKSMDFTIAQDFKRFIETTDGSSVVPESSHSNSGLTKQIKPISSLNNVAKWISGETIEVDSMYTEEFERTPTYEEIDITDEYMDKQKLVTQTTLPIVVDSMNYNVDVPFGSDSMSGAFRNTGMFGFYHPLDTDESLKDTSKDQLKTHINNLSKLGDSRVSSNDLKQVERASSYRNNGEYMIPFAQSSLSGSTAKFETDIMGLSKYTGYLSNYSRFGDIRNGYSSSKSAPSVQSAVNNMISEHKDSFTSDTNYKYLDEVMYTGSDFDEDKLQRYYLPIEIDSPITPNEEHHHYTHIYDIGLNDGGVGFNRIFEYDMYLTGIDGENNAGYLINETDGRENLLKSEEIKHGKSVVIRAEDKIHYAEVEGLRDNLPKLFRMRAFDRDFLELGREGQENQVIPQNNTGY